MSKETKMSPEYEAKLEAFKKEWIGQHIKVTHKDHPHFGETGKVTSVDYTNAGWGIKIESDHQYGESFYVFRGGELKKI